MEELEEALRQSVIITAERECAMAELQSHIEESKQAVSIDWGVSFCEEFVFFFCIV